MSFFRCNVFGFVSSLSLGDMNCPVSLFFRSEKRKRLLNSESDLTEDYPKENDSSR